MHGGAEMSSVTPEALQGEVRKSDAMERVRLEFKR
jgi:hypothetical protein